MERYVKRGKYDSKFNDTNLTADTQVAIRNITEKSATSDEQVAHTKKRLEHQSGAFIDSLNEFILTYTSINQVSANDFYLYYTDHTLKCINLVEGQYENVPYSLKYHIKRGQP